MEGVNTPARSLVQLQGFGSVPTNGGFVLDYARNYPSLADPGEVTLPAIQTLAACFTVC
jgi:hypothetical protein